MGILVQERQRGFVATVSNVDLSRPLDAPAFAEVRDAFHRYAVLVFPEQAIDDERQIAFSVRFGPLETSIRKDRKRAVDRPEISDISNIDERHRLLDPDDERAIYNAGNRLWHSDSSFKRVPAMASLLHAREVPPEGGETEYADLRAAWDALPAWRREGLEALVAVHDFAYSRGTTGYADFTEAERAAVPPVPQALVRVHPATGRKALYLGSHASHIVGWPLAKGRILLLDLLAHATQPEFVYRHTWRVGDLVMWDNRCVLHRGRPWDEARHRRVMHRTTVAGAGPTAIDGRPVR
ncbi:MAG: TauD/TfdA family dioxygenase [Candidatus Rokubacteria bacterium]|nr:TauD/TfdA family dioxygenase [Candidatus Rokubacteria bacterium]